MTMLQTLAMGPEGTGMSPAWVTLIHPSPPAPELPCPEPSSLPQNPRPYVPLLSLISSLPRHGDVKPK